MQGYIAFGAFLSLGLLVIIRARQLKSAGIKAIQFGEMDKKDFLIPPFVLLFIYLLTAFTFDLPRFGGRLFYNDAASWVGVAFCLAGVCFFAWAIVSFGRSFRVGLDEDNPGSLVTTGAFSISRNPIYVAFFLVLLGIFLVFASEVFLVALIAAALLFSRQIRLEEKSLSKVYGQEYERYKANVRRYL